MNRRAWISSAGVVRPDQEVRAQAHDLPEYQKLEEVVCANGTQYAGHGQADLRVLPRLACLFTHVAQGVDYDEEGEERYQEQEQGAQVVDEKSEPDLR